MPISLACIILTSLEPSPMARVVSVRWSLTMRMTWAFCLGVLLQTTTLFMAQASVSKWVCHWGLCMIKARHSPSTMRLISLCCWAETATISSISRSLSSTFSFSRTRMIWLSIETKPQDLDMFSAVSNLSPVNIHIFMFALRISLITSPTSSYSLSSIALHPIISIFHSIVFTTFPNDFLSPPSLYKLLYSLLNSLNISLLISRYPKHNVLNPSLL